MKTKKIIFCITLLVTSLIAHLLFSSSALADFNSSRGIYLIFNSDQYKRNISDNVMWNDIIADPNRIDLLEGVQYRVSWKWLEPTLGNFDWNYLIGELQDITSIQKSNGEFLKVDLVIDISIGTPPWLHQSPYSIPKFYYKDSQLQSNGSREYVNSTLALPWDSNYITKVNDLITALKNNLSPEQYASINQISVTVPGGATDSFLMPLGQDDQTVVGAKETRSTVYQNHHTLNPFYHNYDLEWVDHSTWVASGKSFTTNSPYVITGTTNYLSNKLYTAYRTIEDHLATNFLDKFLVRSVYLSDPKNAPNSSVSKDILTLWPVILEESLSPTKYQGRYLLQVNALKAYMPEPTRYDFDNILEKYRQNNKAIIAFEMLWDSSNSSFYNDGTPNPDIQGALRKAFINGLNRGAQAFRVYMKELENDNPYLQTHIDDFKFVQDYYEGNDYSAPTDITDLSATPGANDGEIKLTWSAPADDNYPNDGPVGVVSSYVIKYSTDANFTPSKTYTYNQSLVPARVGATENFTLSGLTPGTYYIAIKAKDDAGKSSAWATGSGIAPNNPPQANTDNATTNEDAYVIIDVLANDLDIDNDSLNISSVTYGLNGTATATFARSIKYIPNNNFNGSDSFTYTIDDGHGHIATAMVNVSVNPVNDAPVLGNIGNKWVNEGQVLSFTISATDPDNDVLNYSGSNLPPGAVFYPLIQTFDWTPGYEQAGSYTNVHFEVSDGVLKDYKDINITVNNVNRKPQANDQTRALNEDSYLAITLTATDPDSDPLTYSIVTQPSKGVLSGTVPNVTYTPNSNYNGSDYFTFKVYDGSLYSNIATVSLTINSINDAPVANNDTISTNEDTPVNISVLSNDTDQDAGDSLTVTGVTPGTKGTTTIINLNRVIKYTPNSNLNGTDSFTYTIDDGHGATDTAIVNVTINPINDAPVLNAIGNKSVNEGVLLTFTIAASDVDNSTLTYSASNLPAGASFSPSTRTFSWTPTSNQGGTTYKNYQVTFTVSDGILTDGETITIKVYNKLP